MKTPEKSSRLEDLLDRLRLGDAAARDQLIDHCCEQLRSQVSRMLRRYPGVHRWDETDDVLQGAMLRLHKSLARVHPDTLRGFLGLATEHIRRELNDLHRKYFGPEGLGANHASAGPSTGQSSSVGPSSLDPSDLNPGPFTWNEREEWRSQIHCLIHTLPNDEREVVDLRFYHGLTENEIAKIQDVSVRTVRRRWRRARLVLHQSLRQTSSTNRPPLVS